MTHSRMPCTGIVLPFHSGSDLVPFVILTNVVRLFILIVIEKFKIDYGRSDCSPYDDCYRHDFQQVGIHEYKRLCQYI